MSLDEQVRVLSQRVGMLEDEAEITRRLAGFDQRGAERERLYRFIEAEEANFSLTMLCRVCQVSRSAYYSWRADGHGADQATWDEALLADAIFDTWKASRRAYGSPRVSVSLAKAGWRVNEKRVARLMGELAIAGKHGRRKLVTTRRDRDATPAPDLVQRDFSAERPDELWVGDITYVATGEGWLFVASVLDVFSRRLVGWSIADHLRTELCLDALQAACASRGRLRFVGTKFHSDHGCQYTSADFKKRCRAMGITQSMGTVGDSYDNAMAESFWSSLKRELVDGAYFPTKEDARLAIFEWIIWYNNERFHSSLGYATPQEFEESWDDQEAA